MGIRSPLVRELSLARRVRLERLIGDLLASDYFLQVGSRRVGASGNVPPRPAIHSKPILSLSTVVLHDTFAPLRPIRAAED